MFIFPQIPPLQCVTCYNMVNVAIRSLHKGPSRVSLPGCFCMLLIQWGLFCQSCGESFPALLLGDILSQNVNKKGCERLDGREEGTVMDRGEFLGQVAAGVRDGRDEGGGQGGSKVDKQQVTLICCLQYCTANISLSIFPTSLVMLS